MGQSTDAYLFYGIESGEEYTDKREMLETLGLLGEDDGEDGDYFDHDAWLPEGMKGESHWLLNVDAGDYAIPIICIEDTFMMAYRGSVHKFDELPEVDEELKKTLTEYAEKLGWDPPSWMIASMWC